MAVKIYFESLAEELGGKGAWSRIVERFKTDIRFLRPNAVQVGISEIWRPFIEHPLNVPVIARINAIIRRERAAHGTLSEEAKKELYSPMFYLKLLFS